MNAAFVDLRAYCLGLGEAVSAYHEAFKKDHPEFLGSDMVLVFDAAFGEEIQSGYLTRIESAQGQEDSDAVGTQRAINLCQKFLAAEKTNA